MRQGGSRQLKETKLEQAIRYADEDPVEDWLNRLLLLDATEIEMINDGYPDPKQLELYYVNRDTLFSFHKTSEAFLKKIMSLFVSSHYKNSPNDLQLLSDAPSHGIFILTKSLEKMDRSLPDVYAAIQIAEEGGIDKSVIESNNRRGFKPAGDLIPWTIGEQYHDQSFAHKKGIRVVRVATHPDCNRMGYGTRAMELLTEYYEGKMINLDETAEKEQKATEGKKKLPPLMSRLCDIKPTKVDYIGTAYGLTKELFNFWKKNKFLPVYLKLAENDMTGEHSCIMIRPTKDDTELLTEDDQNNQNWLHTFSTSFKKRMVTLLAFEFRSMSVKLALSLLDPNITSTTEEGEGDTSSQTKLTKEQLDILISHDEYLRLERYTKNLVKFQTIFDLIPNLARIFFLKKSDVRLSYIQAGILLGCGLQYKNFSEIIEEFNVQESQVLAMFNKMIKKFTGFIKRIYYDVVDKEQEKEQEQKVTLKTDKSLSLDLKQDLVEEASKVKEQDQAERKKYLSEKFIGNKRERAADK